MQDQFIHDTQGGAHTIGNDEVILFGGEDIPKGSRILDGIIHTDDHQVAGTTSIEIFIGSEEDIDDDIPEIRMIADGDSTMSVKTHGEFRLLPVVRADYPDDGSSNVPPLTKNSTVAALVTSSGLGWDIEGSALVVTILYVLD